MKYSALSATTTALSEGVTPAENTAPTISKVTMTPSMYGAWVSYTDVLDLENFDPVVSETTSILGEMAALSIDTIIRDAISTAGTIDYTGTAAALSDIDTSDDLFNYKDYLALVAQLQANNAMPLDGDLFPVITHPYVVATLFNDSNFVTLFTREGGDAIRSGRIGTIMGTALYVTSNSKTTASDVTVHQMLAIGREAYGMAGFSGLVPDYNANVGGGEYDNMTGKGAGKPVEIIVKDLGVNGNDPLNQRGTIGWKASHTQAILNSAWIVNQYGATPMS